MPTADTRTDPVEFELVLTPDEVAAIRACRKHDLKIRDAIDRHIAALRAERKADEYLADLAKSVRSHEHGDEPAL